MRHYATNDLAPLPSRRLREARLRLGLSQYDVAIRLQLRGLPIDQGTICRIECGKRGIASFELAPLAEVLGVSSDWLRGE